MTLTRNTHFGSWDRYHDFREHNDYEPKYAPPKFLRPLPHAGDLCPCQRCDAIRIENAAARVSINWKPCYPPKFYSSVNWEEWQYE